MRKFIFFILLLILNGCATFSAWTQMKGEEYKDGARKFSAFVPKDWMRYNQLKYFIMTKDGIILDQIAVDRQKVNTKLEFAKKIFLSDMNIQDLAEIEIDNFKSNPEISKLHVIENKPITIADKNGFRVEYTYHVAKGGLKIHGIHHGFLFNNYVYRIHYEAADQHYFKKYLPDFNNFIASFKVLE